MIPLKRFLDISYVLLVDEYQRVGVDLLSALEKTQQWVAGVSKVEVEKAPAVTNQNDQAMAALKARMAGVAK